MFTKIFCPVMVAPNRWISREFVSDLVSVIIPTYNRPSFLKEAIQSVVEQTYRPLECIIIDDGSTDNVRTVVDETRNTYSDDVEIKYISQVRSGAQVARNVGTKLSKGEFIQYLDSDDLLYPQKLHAQVELLKLNKEVDAVFGNWEKGDKDHSELIEVFAREDLVEQFLTEKCIANFSMLMRRELVIKIGPWDERINRYQEVDYHLRGVLVGGRFAFQKISAGLHRLHEGHSITSTKGTSHILHFYQKWEKVLMENRLFTNSIKQKFVTLFTWFLYRDLKYAPVQVAILKEILRLDPENEIFSLAKISIDEGSFGYTLVNSTFFEMDDFQ